MPYILRPKLRGRMLATVVGALAVAFGAVPAAEAACASGQTTKAFAAFGDSADYSLAPGGSFESGASGWSLRSAWVAFGNEPFRVGGAGDSRSLSLSRSGEAVSPAFCVGVEHPSFRFFARRVSGYGGALHVSVRWSDDGISKERTVGVVSGAVSRWAPSASLSLAPSIGIFDDRTVDAQIVFDPADNGGGWAIDDVYVDPFARG